MCDGYRLDELQNEVYDLEREISGLKRDNAELERDLEHERYQRREAERIAEMHGRGW